MFVKVRLLLNNFNLTPKIKGCVSRETHPLFFSNLHPTFKQENRHLHTSHLQSLQNVANQEQHQARLSYAEV